MVVFKFPDLTERTKQMGSPIHGLRHGGNRPIDMALKFPVRYRLSDRERDWIMRCVLPAMDRSYKVPKYIQRSLENKVMYAEEMKSEDMVTVKYAAEAELAFANAMASLNSKQQTRAREMEIACADAAACTLSMALSAGLRDTRALASSFSKHRESVYKAYNGG